MYNQASQSQLREKLDYELWLLKFLSETQETFNGGSNISTVTLMNRQPTGATIGIALTEVVGSGTAIKVMNAMMPLTFTASFKILDMIFEWILEENYNAGIVKNKKAPSLWPFSQKITAIQDPKLGYPPLMQAQPYIREYTFVLYSNLLKFRHEIVHKNMFSVLDGKLKVETSEDSRSFSVELDRGELSALVRIVVAAANLLTGVLSLGEQEDCLLKYHFDRIGKLHGLAEFGQKKPILMNVELKVPVEEGVFLADLKFVRERISQIHPGATVLFNLKVIGLVNNKPSICWFFPIDSVPKEDIFSLQPDSHKEHLIPLRTD